MGDLISIGSQRLTLAFWSIDFGDLAFHLDVLVKNQISPASGVNAWTIPSQSFGFVDCRQQGFEPKSIFQVPMFVFLKLLLIWCFGCFFWSSRILFSFLNFGIPIGNRRVPVGKIFSEIWVSEWRENYCQLDFFVCPNFKREKGEALGR